MDTMNDQVADLPDNSMAKLLAFIGELDRRRIFRRLASVREAVMVEVHVPGERWEVEFFADGHVEVEVFKSTGGVLSHDEAEAALEGLLREADEWEAEAEKRQACRRLSEEPNPLR